jgi:membrane protease YdiL (CAAX protease family)
MIKTIEDIIFEVSQAITLVPGDIIFSGTPAGVGAGFTPPRYLKAGDVVELEISGIGTLINVFCVGRMMDFIMYLDPIPVQTNFFIGVVMMLVGGVVEITLPNVSEDIRLMLSYFCSMFAVYGMTILVERVAFKRVLPVYNAKSGFNPVVLLLGFILTLSVAVILLPLEHLLSPDSRTFSDGFGTFLVVVLLAPILEEMVFRARLYNILSRNTSPFISASLSALAFGVVHMEPIVIIEALFMGVIFSYFYLSQRSIFTPIMLHIFNNSVAYALIVLSYNGESLRELIGSSADVHIGVYLLCSLIVMAGAVFIIRFFVLEKRRMRGIECQDMETIADHLDDEEI